MIPSPPLRLGFDVELLVMTHGLARLVQEAVAHAACIVGLACQDVGERCLDRRAILFRFGLHPIQESRGPRVLSDPQLDLLYLGLVEEQIRMAGDNALLCDLRGSAKDWR